MQCPRTKKTLKEVDINGIKIDISEGCGGVWFDNFELEKFDEVQKPAGDELVGMLENHRKDDIDLEQRLKCPKCQDVTMQRHFFSVKQKVEIDVCPQCAGIWLDPGELMGIRRLYETEDDRKQAAEMYFQSLFAGDPDAQAMKEKSAEDLLKAKRIANLFRFICPTYYVPGEQDFGAF